MNYSMHVDSVRMRFGDRTILGDIAMGCNTGDIVGLFGRNGTGKSTLMHILAGTLQAEQCYLRINDEVVTTVAQRMKYICYLPQNHYIPQHMKAGKAIALSLSKDRTEMLHNDPLLKPVIENRIRDLSGGERRYLEILLVLHHHAPFVLLDEPFNGLSPLMKDYILEKITESSAAKGIIMTDHDYEHVIRISNRKLLLKDGFLKTVNNTAELADNGYLSR